MNLPRLALLTFALCAALTLLSFAALTFGRAALYRDMPLAVTTLDTTNDFKLHVIDACTRLALRFNGGFGVWSADRHLAFVSYRDGSGEIYVWDGGVLTNVSQSPACQRLPAKAGSLQLRRGFHPNHQPRMAD